MNNLKIDRLAVFGHVVKEAIPDWPKRYPAIKKPTQCEISKRKQLVSFEGFTLEVIAYQQLTQLVSTALMYTFL